MTEDSFIATTVRITLTVTPDILEHFCLLVGGGFRVRAQLGCSIRGLLCTQLGIDAEYLDDRIQTIFLNGQVVDDPDSAIVPPGSTLALSAAMPGVAGAMLRKNSRYAPMRSRLSYARPNDEPEGNIEGDVVVQLFNLLQQELGPRFLRQGIRIPGRALRRLLAGRWETFQAGIVTAEVSGEPAAPAVLRDTDWTQREVLLVVREGRSASTALSGEPSRAILMPE
jgi:hypothetical protein